MGPLFPIHLDRRSRLPLQRQLYDQLRAGILAGRVSPSGRLPATRTLAADLAVSRNTVAAAFDQLLAEGYLEGRVGSGTFVAASIPDDLLRVSSVPRRAETGPAPRLSRRGRMLASTSVSPSRTREALQPFQTGVPALDVFPRELWARLAARAVRRSGPERMGYADPAGFAPLRRAVAEYLRAARGVRCSWEQVVITAGSQQALDLAARVLLDPGDTAWVEDPGYMGARGAFIAAGVRCAPVAVDAGGLSVDDGAARYPDARMAYCTPSRQYPMGVTMPLARRMALLAWARDRAAWIVEDDYDSEFRYAGRPLACLQGLDAAGRVIYTGTFSKVLFPALRLGYLVAPQGAVDAFVSARALADRHPPVLEQAIVADFIDSGHFARHVRRMRALYAERQAALVAAAARHLAGHVDIQPAEAGMHLLGWLPHGTDDLDASRKAAAAGVSVPALSQYVVRARPRPALLFGYAAYPLRRIREAVGKLSDALSWNSREPTYL
jgi:GntR family transcriptional regulator/MocR family aminotransferase